MSLPLLPLQISTKEIDGKSYKLRAFNVGQETLLLLVKNSKDPKEIYEALIQLIDECWLDKTHGADKLPPYLIDAIFIQLRLMSDSNAAELHFRCNNPVSDSKRVDGTCGEINEVTIDMSKVYVKKEPNYREKFKIGEGSEAITFVFKPATVLESVSKIKLNQKPEEVLADRIKGIFQGDEVFPIDDIPREELVAWCTQIPTSLKIQITEDFFGALPSIYLEHPFKCPKCGKEHKIEFTSLLDFFI